VSRRERARWRCMVGAAAMTHSRRWISSLISEARRVVLALSFRRREVEAGEDVLSFLAGRRERMRLLAMIREEVEEVDWA
jgi:hypothetical protein